MTGQRKGQETLLTVEAAAERMGTSVRFVRRLVAERRIGFIKLGRLVRIAESDIDAFIEAGRMPAITSSDGWRAARRIALCLISQVTDGSAASVSFPPVATRFVIRGQMGGSAVILRRSRARGMRAGSLR
jgi:excisionase family DNA binding protein